MTRSRGVSLLDAIFPRVTASLTLRVPKNITASPRLSLFVSLTLRVPEKDY